MDATEARGAALKQVEFYFADANLPFDKFLFTLTQKNEEGWVPLNIISSFKRMKPIREAIGIEGIAECLRDSKELLEVDEKGENVRRKVPLVQVKDAHARSIYAKGFPDEYPTLQLDLEKFFAQFGKVNGVRMRRENEKPRKFKNSVFVEFATAQETNAFLDKAKEAEPVEDGGHGVKYGETALQVMSKCVCANRPAYVAMKMKEKGIDPGSNQGKGKGPRKFNAFREMEKRDGKEQVQSLRSQPLEFEYNGKTLITREDGTVDPASVEFPERSVLRFTGAAKGGNWKDLKVRIY